MAKKKLRKRNNTSKPVKPKATPEQIEELARNYRTMVVGETPDDLYYRRDRIHNEMAKYSNPQEINDAMRTYDEQYSPEEGVILVPFRDIFPGYQPIINHGRDSRYLENSVIGYEPKPGYLDVPEGYEPVIDDFPDDLGNAYPPDFENTYVWYKQPDLTSNKQETVDLLDSDIYDEPLDSDEDRQTEVTYPVVDKQSTDNEYPAEDDDVFTMEEVDGTPTVEEVQQFNPTVQDVPEIQDILEIGDTLEDEDDIQPNHEDALEPTETLNNEYFPSTLNQSVYAPSLNIPEPELDDDTYDRIYNNRDASRSFERKKVYLPEEVFINKSDLGKIQYEVEQVMKQNPNLRSNYTPEASLLLDYAYDWLSPIPNYVYPNISAWGFYFDPVSRKYKYRPNR